MGDSSKKVLIVGGGFGGIEAAKHLSNRSGVDVTLIDRRNYHLFQPLLYQVAMAGLSPADIAVPIRGVLAGAKNIQVLLGNVERVELSSGQVHSDIGTLTYDYLVLACGSKHSYFGHEDWEVNAPGLKTLEQATEIRRRVLTAFELAEREADPAKRVQLLTFIVVGGGPTGVELAGAVGEISRHTLARDFKRIDPSLTQILLVEAGPRILPGFDPSLSEKAELCLKRLGVTLLKERRVTDVDAEGVQVGEERIASKTVLWAAGVQPSSINPTLGMKVDSQGRVVVEKDLSLTGHPNVFVIGDQACVLGSDGKPLPGLAPVAIQQGRYIGKLIAKEARGRADRRPYRYIDKGQMATIGRSYAVLQMGKLKLHGFIAWCAWLFVHIYYLIGFKNRFFVFIQWTWYYLTYARGARLIVHKEWRSFGKSPGK